MLSFFLCFLGLQQHMHWGFALLKPSLTNPFVVISQSFGDNSSNQELAWLPT
jgi:hypothetical protein